MSRCALYACLLATVAGCASGDPLLTREVPDSYRDRARLAMQCAIKAKKHLENYVVARKQLTSDFLGDPNAFLATFEELNRAIAYQKRSLVFAPSSLTFHFDLGRLLYAKGASLIHQAGRELLLSKGLTIDRKTGRRIVDAPVPEAERPKHRANAKLLEAEGVKCLREASGEFEVAYKINSMTWQALWYMAWCAYGVGDLEVAEQRLKDVLREGRMRDADRKALEAELKRVRKMRAEMAAAGPARVPHPPPVQPEPPRPDFPKEEPKR